MCRICTAESVVLTPCPPGPLARLTVISRSCGIDLDVDLLGLGQHGDRDGRGVDPAVGLGHRHPLDPVDAALELELLVHVGPGDQEATSLSPPRSEWLLLIGCTFQPCASAYFWYSRASSAAKSAASSPPGAGPDLHHRIARIGRLRAGSWPGGRPPAARPPGARGAGISAAASSRIAGSPPRPRRPAPRPRAARAPTRT